MKATADSITVDVRLNTKPLDKQMRVTEAKINRWLKRMNQRITKRGST